MNVVATDVKVGDKVNSDYGWIKVTDIQAADTNLILIMSNRQARVRRDLEITIKRDE